MLKALTLEVIRAQKQDALQRREELYAEIALVNEEIEDCEASERMFARINDAIKSDIGDLFMGPVQEKLVGPALQSPEPIGPYKPDTTKHYIWQCLKNSQNRWLTAVEIRRIASRAKGEDIPMSSISPMINAIMKQGHIVRDGLKVALKERIETKNPATEAAGL